MHYVTKTNEEKHSCTYAYTYVSNLARFVSMIRKYFTLYSLQIEMITKWRILKHAIYSACRLQEFTSPQSESNSK